MTIAFYFKIHGNNFKVKDFRCYSIKTLIDCTCNLPVCQSVRTSPIHMQLILQLVVIRLIPSHSSKTLLRIKRKFESTAHFEDLSSFKLSRTSNWPCWISRVQSNKRMLILTYCKLATGISYMSFYLYFRDKMSKYIYQFLQLRIEGHFGFQAFWTKFWNILKYGMNLNLQIIVQIFRKTIQLNAVNILKTLTNTIKNLSKNVAPKWPFILLWLKYVLNLFRLFDFKHQPT